VRRSDGDGVAFVAGASITGCSSTNVASVLADELRFAFAVAVGAFKGLSPFDRTNARNASSLSGVTADRVNLTKSRWEGPPDRVVLIISRKNACS
jgi:hypothetical protein